MVEEKFLCWGCMTKRREARLFVNRVEERRTAAVRPTAASAAAILANCYGLKRCREEVVDYSRN